MFLTPPPPILGEKKLEYVTYVEAMSRSGSTMTAASLSGGASIRKYFLLHWWAASNTRSLDTLTFNGETCSILDKVDAGTTRANVELWYIDTGTASGDLVATFSGSMTTDNTTNRERCDVAVFSGTALTTGGVGKFSNILSGNPLTSSAFDIPENAWVISGMTKGGSPTIDCTWSSFTEIADLEHSAFAFDSGLAADPGHVEVVTMSGNRSDRRLLCVSFN